MSKAQQKRAAENRGTAFAAPTSGQGRLMKGSPEEAAQLSQMIRQERRKDRRLDIRLPVECSFPGQARSAAYRTVTLNVSTGGLYFETEAIDIRPGMLVRFELTVPPGDGHFPYQGRVTGLGEVVRVAPLRSKLDAAGLTRNWVGVGTRFKENLKLSF
jgi:hypothetical protein